MPCILKGLLRNLICDSPCVMSAHCTVEMRLLPGVTGEFGIDPTHFGLGFRGLGFRDLGFGV